MLRKAQEPNITGFIGIKYHSYDLRKSGSDSVCFRRERTAARPKSGRLYKIKCRQQGRYCRGPSVPCSSGRKGHVPLQTEALREIEKLLHGKLESFSWTCLLLRGGACGPALSTGRPVIGSRRMLTFRGRALRGVNMMRPHSNLTSRGSPARRPSLRRIETGRTTWPLVEILVLILR